MTEQQQNIQRVRDAYDAFVRGDIQAILNQLTDDVLWESPGPAQIPYAGTYYGKDGAAEFFRILAKTEDPLTFEPRRYFADGDMVIVLGRYGARVKSTGALAETDWVHTFTFAGGKVSQWHEYFDTAKYAQAYATPAATGAR